MIYVTRFCEWLAEQGLEDILRRLCYKELEVVESCDKMRPEEADEKKTNLCKLVAQQPQGGIVSVEIVYTYNG